MENTKNNQVYVNGIIVTNPEYSHEVLGEQFYTMTVAMKRKSGTEDILPVIVSERLWNVTRNCVGAQVEMEGEYRSRNVWDGEKRCMELHVFAKEIRMVDAEEEMREANQITLTGFLCKKPIYRTTPQGREICDVILAVNRAHGKSDYIPCIFWGRNARYMSEMEVGTKLSLTGRIQSREYVKRYDTYSEVKVAYEVSVTAVELVAQTEVTGNVERQVQQHIEQE